MTVLQTRAAEIFESNKQVGWWDDWPVRRDRHETAMMLVVTELAEAAEGARKDIKDTHLTHRDMFHVELADAIIRLLDLAGAYNLKDIDKEVLRHEQHMRVFLAYKSNKLESLFAALSYCLMYSVRDYEQQVLAGLGAVYAVAAKYEVAQLEIIIDEKLRYNARRLDHKRSEREKVGGKKW